MLVVNTGSPVLPSAFDLEDCLLVSGSIVIDALESRL